jgi:hypothetical protein
MRCVLHVLHPALCSFTHPTPLIRSHTRSGGEKRKEQMTEAKGGDTHAAYSEMSRGTGGGTGQQQQQEEE